MHVDLGDFRFLAAERDGRDGPEAVSLLVSRSSQTGFVQMVTHRRRGGYRDPDRAHIGGPGAR